MLSKKPQHNLSIMEENMSENLDIGVQLVTFPDPIEEDDMLFQLTSKMVTPKFASSTLLAD